MKFIDASSKAATPVQKKDVQVLSRRGFYVAIAVIVLLMAGNFLTGPFLWHDVELHRLLQEMLIGVAATLCFVRCWRIADERLAWGCLGFAILFWDIGNILAPTVDTASVTLADGFWWAFYLLATVSLLLIAKARLYQLQSQPWMEGIIVALAFSTVFSAVAFKLTPRTIEENLFSSVINLLYPTMDAFLLAIIISIALMYRKMQEKSLAWMAVGFALFTAADTTFFYLSSSDQYHVGDWLDFLWVAATLCMAAAAYLPYYRIPGEDNRSSWAVRLWIPLFCSIVAVVVLISDVFHLHFHPITSVFAVLTLIAVLSRMIILFKQSQENLLHIGEVEEQLRDAQAIAHVGSWQVKYPGQEVLWSMENYQILGVDPNGPLVTRELFFQLVIDEDQELLQAWSEAMQGDPDGNTTHQQVLRIRRQNDQQLRYIRVRGKGFSVGNDHFTRGTTQDVTESRERQHQLEQQEQQYRLLAENSSDIVVRYNSEGVCLYISPSVKTATGYTPEEILNQKFYQWIQMEDVEQIYHIDLWDNLPEQDNTRRVQFRIIKKNGDPVWYDAVIKQILNEETGEVTEVQAALRDISERIRIERMKDDLISLVGHELRTPLTSILVSLELLLDDVDELAPETQRLLEISERNAQRLSGLVNSILHLERLQSGTMDFAPRLCKTQGLLVSAKEAMEEKALSENKTIVVDNQAESAFVDPDRIQQLLVNLLSNAIKFSFDGGEIRLVAREDEDHTILEVIDHGRGIPEDQQHIIFQRFKQVEISDATEKGGSGLGLTIVEAIAKQHNGEVQVDSTPGQGSTFRILLPKK